MDDKKDEIGDVEVIQVVPMEIDLTQDDDKQSEPIIINSSEDDDDLNDPFLVLDVQDMDDDNDDVRRWRAQEHLKTYQSKHRKSSTSKQSSPSVSQSHNKTKGEKESSLSKPSFPPPIPPRHQETPPAPSSLLKPLGVTPPPCGSSCLVSPQQQTMLRSDSSLLPAKQDPLYAN